MKNQKPFAIGDTVDAVVQRELTAIEGKEFDPSCIFIGNGHVPGYIIARTDDTMYMERRAQLRPDVPIKVRIVGARNMMGETFPEVELLELRESTQLPQLPRTPPEEEVILRPYHWKTAKERMKSQRLGNPPSSYDGKPPRK